MTVSVSACMLDGQWDFNHKVSLSQDTYRCRCKGTPCDDLSFYHLATEFCPMLSASLLSEWREICCWKISAWLKKKKKKVLLSALLTVVNFLPSSAYWYRQCHTGVHTKLCILLFSYSWVGLFKLQLDFRIQIFQTAIKNGFEMHFGCDLSPFRIQTSTWSYPYIFNITWYCNAQKAHNWLYCSTDCVH